MSYTTADGDVWCCERCYRLAQESADPWPDTEDAAAAHYAACNPEPEER